LEIGPGTGALTRELLARGVFVIAIEADIRAVESLEQTFAAEIESGRLTLHHHDARSLSLQAFGLKPHGYKVVANIPYYISGLLFRTFLESDCQPQSLVFLVQKEVAARIARDKKESLLSLSVKAYGAPTYICTISRGHFTPPPKVDSAIIAVADISKRNFLHLSEAEFFTLLHVGFGQKRKQLLSNLTQQYPRTVLEDVFSSLGISKTIRAEDVSCTTWLKLISTLQSTAKSPTT
jgi:16S rRNA (adenine1518-N6/adenine1519-N6)-dimethyltransferase